MQHHCSVVYELMPLLHGNWLHPALDESRTVQIFRAREQLKTILS